LNPNKEHTMKRLHASLAFILTTGASPAAVVAQSSDDATASVQVTSQAATVVKTLDMQFGQQPPNTVVRSSDVGAAAEWNVSFSQTGDYVFSFTLPDVLVGAAGNIVPIDFGSESASVSRPDGSVQLFNPVAPVLVPMVSAGTAAVVDLGRDHAGSGDGNAVVDLFGALDGVYTGVITFTVGVQ
jgi:hypothetical protein